MDEYLFKICIACFTASRDFQSSLQKILNIKLHSDLAQEQKLHGARMELAAFPDLILAVP